MQALVRIEPVGEDEYVRDVLPETFAMWGGKRSLERYVEDFRTFARAGYGRRPFTVGVREGGRVVCSCKSYAREIRWNASMLRATGIGSVFTAPSERGRGYASLMLGAFLDAERAAGTDVAFLYSDIHPAFYERLGFLALPSRAFSIRASSLDGSHAGGEPLEARDWPALRRCFEALERERTWSIRRTPPVWDWLQRMWSRTPAEGVQRVQLVVRRPRAIAAYVLGRRSPREDAFVVDEFGFDRDAGRRVLPALLRAGAGDLARVRGWLPPTEARAPLPRAAIRARKGAILMIAPLSGAARRWWSAVKDETLQARGDAGWESDHI